MTIPVFQTIMPPLLKLVSDSSSGDSNFTFLDKERHLLHRHVRACRPLGEDVFVVNLLQVLLHSLRPQKLGPKRKWMGVKYTVPGIRKLSLLFKLQEKIKEMDRVEPIHH